MNQAEVYVLQSCPDARLRGYCGVIVASRDHEVLVRFAIKIHNEVSEAWIATRFVGPLLRSTGGGATSRSPATGV